MLSKHGLRSLVFVSVVSSNLVSAIRSRYLGLQKEPHDGNETWHDGPFDCVGWPNSGACTQCLAHVTYPLGSCYAECMKCPEGWALLAGPPIKAEKGFDEFEFTWNTHCAPLVGAERRVIIIRHGQSVWNKVMKDYKKLPGLFGAFAGHDSPLSKLGLRQAQRLAQILKKASEEVYGPTEPSEAILKRDDMVDLSSARSELSQVNLEDVLKIVDQTSGETISDEVLVKSLAKKENREALDVLLGRRCDETNFVSSQLTRAMDTLIIGTLESRLTCEWDWKISSNLQEIEHNSDCTPNAQPFHHPVQAAGQRNAYTANGMRKTKDYVASRYAHSDVTRFKKNYGMTERARLFDQSAQMLDELEWMFSEDKMFTVWAGHSIWFRHFFIKFADRSNPDCKKLTEIKMANTAVVSFKVRRAQEDMSPVGFAVTDCKFIHLGDNEDYKLKLNEEDADALIPHPSDFDYGVSRIMGWKCCCSRTSHMDAKVWFEGWLGRKSLEICVLAKTEKCKKPKQWMEIWPKDMSFKDTAVQYHWGHNNGPCEIKVDYVDDSTIRE